MNEAAFKYLKMAEKLCMQAQQVQKTPQIDQMLALTYNNLGCIYKKNSKPNVALQYMLKALKVESESAISKSQQAGTKLNICAILSQLNKHTEAIKYCKAATNDLMATLKMIRLKNMKNLDKRKLLMEAENLTE